MIAVYLLEHWYEFCLNFFKFLGISQFWVFWGQIFTDIIKYMYIDICAVRYESSRYLAFISGSFGGGFDDRDCFRSVWEDEAFVGIRALLNSV